MGAVMRARRERWLQYKADPQFLEAVLAEVAAGGSLADVAAVRDIPYTTLHRWLTSQHADRLAAAREAKAMGHVERMQWLADEVEAGRIEPNAARVSGDLRKWLAAKLDGKTWGDVNRIDMQVRGVVDLHVQAVRQFVQGAAGEAVDAEYDEIDDIPSGPASEPGDEPTETIQHDHPLL